MSGNKRAAPEEFTNNIDAMKCLIMAMSRDVKVEQENNKRMKTEIVEVKLSNQYMHRQIERLDGYTQELETRIDGLKAVVENMLNRGRVERDLTQDAIADVRVVRLHNMEDLDNLLAEIDTEDEEEEEFATALDLDLLREFGEDDDFFGL